ncbi:hypothetical protein Tco_1118519 [Tanacetum coccineum]
MTATLFLERFILLSCAPGKDIRIRGSRLYEIPGFNIPLNFNVDNIGSNDELALFGFLATVIREDAGLNLERVREDMLGSASNSY